MAHKALTLATIILFLHTLFCSSFACNQQDNKALLAFKNSFRYTSLSKTWPDTTTDCCSWKYIGCDNATGRVTSLDFTNDNNLPESIFLNGSIPGSIGDLSALESLTFSRITSLVGPIPPQMSKLKKLQSLTIYVTRVSGPVPSFLSQLPALKQLFLGYNGLSGTIPPSLGNLVSLTDLNLFGNQLTGTIPETLFSKLPKGAPATLVLSDNQLTGSIPQSFANVEFSGVYLHNNNLTGDASSIFGKSKRITTIDLTKNSLQFDLSKVEFPGNAGYIDISHNNIFGSIPDQIRDLPKLTYFDVSYNSLCGKIPSGLLFTAKSFAHNKCLCGIPLEPCK